MPNATLSPEVTDILRRSTVRDNVLVLPPGQLPRPLYEAVNKVLVNAGGKWKTGKGHVFTGDPMTKLGLALETGVSVDEKKLFQAFYTPPALAARVVELAEVGGCSVLEPSAGEGALVKECWAQGAKDIFAVEIQHEAYLRLRDGVYKAGYSTSNIFSGDFLLCDIASVGHLVDRVVMNPPFTKGQDIKHVLHALKFLKPGGRLVAIMSPTAPFKPKFIDGFQALGFMNATVHDVPAGTFKESGTEIATAIVVLNNPVGR